MERVTVVTGLITRTETLIGRNSVYLSSNDPLKLRPVSGSSDLVGDTHSETESYCVPIHQINKRISVCNEDGGMGYGYKKTYIAYSKEVEELLKMPFSCISDENERLTAACRISRRSLEKLSSDIELLKGSFLKRLKFLFTGEYNEKRKANRNS